MVVVIKKVERIIKRFEVRNIDSQRETVLVINRFNFSHCSILTLLHVHHFNMKSLNMKNIVFAEYGTGSGESRPLYTPTYRFGC